MDRYTYYSGEVLPLQGLLQAQQSTMVALATQAQMAIGTGTLVDGFTCTPTIPASLNVLLTAGSIYQQENLEATNWSGLNSDTAHSIMKQGILLDPVTLGITPPVTTGYSQVYLIEVQYADSDTGSTVLPYYNASNPASPYSGPGNAGTAQNTMRKGIVAIQVKAGTAAPTGTQTAPSADAGWVGLFTVTVANGASTITSGNIVTLASAPFLAPNGKLPLIPTGVLNNTWTYATDTGSADALAVALTPAPSAYTAGMEVHLIKGASPNATATPTLNVNGLGNKTIVRLEGGPIAPSDLQAGGSYQFMYDGTYFRVMQFVASSRLTIPFLAFHGEPVAQTIANNTQQIITSYTNIVNNLPGATQASGIITIGTTGFYQCTANMASLMPSGAAYGYAVTVSKVNGSGTPLVSIAAQQTTVSTASLPSNLAGAASGLAKLSAGDKIAAFFIQNTGSSQSVSLSFDIEFRGS
jgi:hypothetical protein